LNGKYEIPIATEESPAFHEYIKFLLDHAFHSPYPVAVTALLPCFWVYGEAGEYILKNTIRNNPYREWIETYSGELFIGYVQRFIEITETLGQKASPIIIKKMEHTFSQATKHELRIYEEAALH
jgi:thiaminase/transcriptional activator TenA